MPIAVACRKIHLWINSERILAQYFVDGAQRFDERAPIGHQDETQTADGVADRYLIGRLLLVFRLDELRHGETGFRQRLLDPCQRQRQRRPLSLQPAGEFRDERAHQRRTRSRHIGDDENQVFRIFVGDRGDLIDPNIGDVAVAPVRADARGDAAQVFDERQPQHDRNRPQFADRQRCRALIGGDEAREIFDGEAAVAVCDGFQRDVVHAGKSGRRAARQARQFPAIAFRQMTLREPYLFFDQVEIIEQPFAGRRYRPVRIDGLHEQSANVDEQGSVFRQARQQQIRSAGSRDAVVFAECFAVLFELIAAEQFRSQRLFLGR